jgi:DNA modification methylase
MENVENIDVSPNCSNAVVVCSTGISERFFVHSIDSFQCKERLNYSTQKPIELIKRIILIYSNEGDTVADFYLGSGTTAVVCKELNRNFIGCDINDKAVQLTISRLNKIL